MQAGRVSVEAATGEDLDELVRLFAGYLDFYERPAEPARIRAFLAERLAHGDSQMFIARDDSGEGLGFVQLYPLFSSLHLGRAWLLNDLFVAPEVRRSGVGEALMSAARQHAESTGSCGIQLETAKTNLAGQALYERLGYRRDDIFHIYWLELNPA
jgi:ribosomal protein S18 acetylase RimI-like enzyme